MDCKYCLESCEYGLVIYPCKCKTPVHEDCLMKWLEYKQCDYAICELCKTPLNNIQKDKVWCSWRVYLFSLIVFCTIVYTCYVINDSKVSSFVWIMSVYALVMMISIGHIIFWMQSVE